MTGFDMAQAACAPPGAAVRVREKTPAAFCVRRAPACAAWTGKRREKTGRDVSPETSRNGGPAEGLPGGEASVTRPTLAAPGPEA